MDSSLHVDEEIAKIYNRQYRLPSSKKSDYFFKNCKSYTDFFLKETRIYQCCQKKSV